MLTFSFPTTSRDYYRSSLEIYKRSQAAKLDRLLLYLPLLIVVLAVVLVLILDINLPFIVLIVAIAMIVLWLASLVLRPQRLQVFHFWKNNLSLLGEQTYSFTEQGMGASGDLSNTDLQWAAIHKIVETKELFLFYISENWAYFLPVVEVQKAGKLDDLRQFLEACAPGRTQMKR